MSGMKLCEISRALVRQRRETSRASAAVTVLAEIGDLSRFQTPREFMGYLGLVPSESSTGNTLNRSGVDFAKKANVPATTLLRERNGIAQLRRIDSNERAGIMPHDSPFLA
jgi:transposase